MYKESRAGWINQLGLICAFLWVWIEPSKNILKSAHLPLFTLHEQVFKKFYWQGMNSLKPAAEPLYFTNRGTLPE